MIQTAVSSPYADFTFYQETYKGSKFTSGTEFAEHALRAEEILDEMTWDKIPNMDAQFMTEAMAAKIRKAVCAMAEVSKQCNPMYTEAGSAAGKSSESNDGYSVSFQDPGTIAATYRSRSEEAARRYLGTTGLLYRGGGDWHDH